MSLDPLNGPLMSGLVEYTGDEVAAVRCWRCKRPLRDGDELRWQTRGPQTRGQTRGRFLTRFYHARCFPPVLFRRAKVAGSLPAGPPRLAPSLETPPARATRGVTHATLIGQAWLADGFTCGVPWWVYLYPDGTHNIAHRIGEEPYGSEYIVQGRPR